MLKDNVWLQWIIALVAAILGARFLSPTALINLVWLPTGIVGIVLTSLLPFIIFFYFIESSKTQVLIRRVGWILFGVLYLGLAATRWSDFELATGGDKFNLGWLYIITAILAFLCFLFDRWVQKKKGESDKKNAAKSKVQFHEHKLAGDLAKLQEDFISATTDRERKRIQDLIKIVKAQAKAAAQLLNE